MRLWSLHPKYLDPQGLVALWREALLARAVIRNETRGYKHHPQLERFRGHASPRNAINAYLAAVFDEAVSRGYAFDPSKLGRKSKPARILVSDGQLAFERLHLIAKLEVRNPDFVAAIASMQKPDCHPLFRPRPGPPATWERAQPTSHKGQST